MRVGKLDPSLADINHIARSGGQRLLLPTSVTRAGLSDHIVSSIRQRVLLWFCIAGFKEISWGGMACSKEKTPLWVQMFPDASQQRFLVCSGQKMLKGISQHVNKWKLLLEMERARICHYPLNRDPLRKSLLGGPFDHLWYDIHPCDLKTLFRHANGHRSGSTRQIKQRPTKRPRPLLGQWIIRIVAPSSAS